jgi:glycosyltransferase involved in cell wall biosynthesis
MSRRPRWLLMAGHVPPSTQGGGIVRYTVELAQALRRRDDVDLHLLASPAASGPLAELVGDAARVVRLPPVPGPALSAFERWGLGSFLGDRFDVVHGAKHLLPRRVAARTALTVHDMLLFDRPDDFGPAKRVLLQRPYGASLRQADTLLCVSAATRARLLSQSPAVSPRTAVVPLATSSRLLAARPVPVDSLAGRPFALVVGDPGLRKNLGTVFSAWHRVVRERPDALLVHIGPPAWGRASYGPDHAALTSAGSVVQLVGVDDGTLRWCYEQAAVVLAPSLVEGFGLPAVEALDLGAPLVTSLDPALVEVTGHRAEHLPAEDVPAWTGAALRHLSDGTRRASAGDRQVRTWDDVAEETVRAVLAGRPH